MGLKLSCLKVWLDETGSCPEDGEMDPEA
uniref:Chromosome 16 open reading frame 74 n=1 Tax=Ailuropoda melanoleuca TaxID=9646 RepID=A0A7N5K171_AILME